MVVFVFVFTREELEQLMAQIQTLEERIKPARTELSSVSAASEKDDVTGAERGLGEGGETDAGATGEEGGGEGLREESEREHASAVIQRNWRQHRERVHHKTDQDGREWCLNRRVFT